MFSCTSRGKARNSFSAAFSQDIARTSGVEVMLSNMTTDVKGVDGGHRRERSRAQKRSARAPMPPYSLEATLGLH